MQPIDIGFLILRVLVFLGGLYIVGATLLAAIKTFVLPRGINVWLTKVVFQSVGAIFRFRARRTTTYEALDKVMALYAPFTLVLLPVVFLTLVLFGYTAMYWALSPQPLKEVFILSGSSLMTLGYASVGEVDFKILEFSEAMIGLILVALLIAYLPTMYSAFTKRETAVALLEGFAGSPPSPVELISRTHRTGNLENLSRFWGTWQVWFAEVEESHTSLAPLAFFRSPKPENSWITSAGIVLDTAALVLSTVDIPWEPRAAFCIRNGFLALRQIADFFGISHPSDPQKGDPISVEKEEFLVVYNRLVAEGVPVKVDIEQAWHDFMGWRVNYDKVLLSLAGMTMAPYAPWVSDRSPIYTFYE